MSLTLSTDQNYWTRRVIATLPAPWQADTAFQPGGFYYALIYNTAGLCLTYAAGQITYTSQQTRIATATDTNLEAIANDFFGVGLFPRLSLLNASTNELVPETDAAYSSRIRAAIFAPKNTLKAIQSAVQNYFNYQYISEVVSGTSLLGLGDEGGLGTIGGLGGTSNNVPPLPLVYVFDRQSDKKNSALVGLNPGQFCILLSYGGLATYGFFVGRAFTNRTDYLINSKIQVISPLTANLSAIVNATKAKGMQPVYADNRVF